MPIHLPPISRRQFVRGSVAAGAAVVAAVAGAGTGAARRVDPNRVALLSDTHVDANPRRSARGVNMARNFRQACREAAALDPAPAHALVNGDLAYDVGRAGDYATAVGLLTPLREAGVPVHVALGNHDHRERFWANLPDQRRPAPAPGPHDKHVALIETPRANWLLLDSLQATNVIRGALGTDQLAWLAATLDRHADKPALILVHHNPEEPDEFDPDGLADTPALLRVLAPRHHARALFYGHTHHWRHTRRPGGLHLVNLPATAYVFERGQPSAWVDARVTATGMTLTLRTLDPAHPDHGQRRTLTWRDA